MAVFSFKRFKDVLTEYDSYFLVERVSPSVLCSLCKTIPPVKHKRDKIVISVGFNMRETPFECVGASSEFEKWSLSFSISSFSLVEVFIFFSCFCDFLKHYKIKKENKSS